MTDQEINEKLAKVMGFDKPETGNIYVRDIDGEWWLDKKFTYSNPAIFAENVSFLVKAFGKIEIKNGDIFRDIALARIEAAHILARKEISE